MQKAHKAQEKLNPEIEKKVKLIESGKAKGKTYTPDEYLKHVNEVLDEQILWLIQPFDDTIDKKLKKFKSNQPLIKNFTNFVEELKTVNDPAQFGEPKHGSYKNCIGKHLTYAYLLC